MSERAQSDRLRVVVDTNLFVSALLRRGSLPDQVVRAWSDERRYHLLTAEPLMAEVQDVLTRPSIVRRYALARDEIVRLVASLRTAERVQLAGALPVAVRDPDDEQILACALGGQADYLVTGDKDLLTLHGAPELGPLRIVTPAQFLRLLDQPL